MKLAVYTIFLALFAIINVESEAFVQSRHQWWKLRAQQLQSKISHPEKSGSAQNTLRELAEKDLADAYRIIAVFEGAIKNDGSLAGEVVKYDHASLEGMAKMHVPAVFSVYYLAALTGRLGDWKNIDNSKQAVRLYLEKRINERFNNDGKALAEMILTEDIELNDWKSMAAEIFFGKMMLSRDEILTTVISGAVKKTENDLRDGKIVKTAQSLRSALVSNTVELMSDGNCLQPGHDAESLELSWTWKKINAKIEREFNHYEAVMSFLGNDGKVSLDRIRYFYRNPSALEAELFGEKIHGRYLYEKSFNDGKKYIAGKNQEILVVPGDMDCKALLAELDEFRKRAIQAVNGSEKGDFFQQLRRKGNSIVLVRMGRARKILQNQETRLRKLREDTGDNSVEIINLKEFESAQKTYDIKYSLANRYKKRTLEFVSWLSDTMRMRDGVVVEAYVNQIARMKEYLEFTVDLTRDCVDASGSESPAVHSSYSQAAIRLEDVFQYFQHSLSIRAREKAVLTQGRYAELMEKKETFLRQLTGAKKSASDHRRQYGVLKARESGIKTASMDQLKNRIAQEEVCLLLKSVNAYADLLRRYTYADSIFTQFALRYDSLEKLASAGNITPELSDVFENYSILQSMENYNEEKLTKEIAARKLVREEVRTGIARLSALLDFYKRRGVVIEDRPGSDEISAVKEAADSSHHVKVADWIMNEMNYGIIDKKSAAKLKHIATRQLWISSSKVKNNEKQGELVSIAMPEGKLCFMVPHGWSEARNSGKVAVMKSYQSLDKQTDVSFARVTAGGKDNRAISEEWIEENNSIKIKERWGNIHGVEYFWTLSRDSDSSVRETFSFSNKGAVLVISGRARKDIYPFFKKKLHEIIETLSY